MQNIVILAGHIGQTPEVRNTNGGTQIGYFSLATSRPRYNDGKPVKDSRQLKFTVAATAPGHEAKINLLRDGKTQTVSVTVANMKTDAVATRGDGAGGLSYREAGVSPALPITSAAIARAELAHHGGGARERGE